MTAAPGPEVLLLRIVIGAALGGVIGYERDRHGRPVGLRTHVIVALAASTFMIVSAYFRYFQNYGPDDLIEVDASRIAASVVSGIGFLATGAILRTGLTIQGLTTAAGLWLVTAIGMCAGSGMYLVAATVTLMGFLALTVLRRFEDKTDDIRRHHVAVLVTPITGSITESIQGLGGTIGRAVYERRLDEGDTIALDFEVTLPKSVSTARLIQTLEAHQGVRRVRVETQP